MSDPKQLRERLLNAIRNNDAGLAEKILGLMDRGPTGLASGDADDIFAGHEFLWARIKPIDHALGQYKGSMSVAGVNSSSGKAKVFRGGTGAPGDIPDWVKVTPEQGKILLTYKNDPVEDPRSPQVFDVVTPDEKAFIDETEEEDRSVQLGIKRGPQRRREKQGLSARTADVTGQSRGPDKVIRQRPALKAGAERYIPEGRSAALADLTPPPPPPPPSAMQPVGSEPEPEPTGRTQVGPAEPEPDKRPARDLGADLEAGEFEGIDEAIKDAARSEGK